MRPVKRTRIRPVSKKRSALRGARAAVCAALFDRDDHRCQMPTTTNAGPCYGPLTPHHLVKAGQGGSYTLDNLVTLCAFHNDWVEDNPDLAVSAGLVIRRSTRD